MNLKAPKTLAMLAAIIAVLFIGGVLLTGCEETEAGKADTDSQTVQDKACSLKTNNPSCEAEKEACQTKGDNPGHEAKACSTKGDNPGHEAKACPTEHTKPCSK